MSRHGETKGATMHVILSSKQVELTEGLKSFVTNRIENLQKFSLNRLQNLQVLLDVDRKKGKKGEVAMVEIIGDLKGKRLAVREVDRTFYKAFFGALSKMKTRLKREKERLVEK